MEDEFFISLLAGLALLVAGAYLLVYGGIGLGRRLHWPPAVVGLTVLTFGTSMPELALNAFASLEGEPAVVYGNIIGSNNFNLFVILGIVGLIFPLRVSNRTVINEIPFAATTVGILLLLLNQENWFGIRSNIIRTDEGFILLMLFLIFMIYQFLTRHQRNHSEGTTKQQYHWLVILLLLAGGAAALFFGAKLALQGGLTLAHEQGWNKQVTGVLVFATGTALPELIAAIIAGYRNQGEMAIGNITGSIIFNTLFIFGLSATLHPLPFDTVLNVDLFFMLIGSFMLFLVMFTGQENRLDRWEAGIFLLGAIFYLIYNLFRL